MALWPKESYTMDYRICTKHISTFTFKKIEHNNNNQYEQIKFGE